MHSISTFRFLTTGRALQEITANYADFMRFTHSSRELQNLHHSHQVWYDQESRNEPSEPKEITVNYADSALFTPTAGKLRKIRDICTPKLRTILLQSRTLL